MRVLGAEQLAVFLEGVLAEIRTDLSALIEHFGLDRPDVRANLAWMRQVIAESGGAAAAADIVESRL
ncbi:hypothetical protein [Saccharopolyspora sp. SCSIO 74807]|uniref:hypothetical protein n=1 Tax=Saccharopolyspora sp. SCSIO 74807 TaxID=3118084 RepID=UPI0030CF1070